MSLAATFDGAPEQGTINLAVGQPSADLLPLALLHGACERFFAGAQPLELNYGERQGDARFRAALAAFLRDTGAGKADPQSLLLTGGVHRHWTSPAATSRGPAVRYSSKNPAILMHSRSSATMD